MKDTTEAMLEASFGFLEDEDSDDEEEREEWEEDGHTAKVLLTNYYLFIYLSICL